ncbi:PIN domain-containing protein [Labrys wisconsinensis]|nr:PIN domain-containing protein [Labrys wisconsinensis]
MRPLPRSLAGFSDASGADGPVRARWTKAIYAEWIRNVLRDRPDLTAAQLDRTRQLMDAHVRDAVVSGYEPLIETLVLPDPDDRHVLAAAIRAGASVIITYNLRDFPKAALDPFSIEAQHPDAFIAHLFDVAPEQVVAAARRQRASLKHPPKTVDDYLDVLLRAELVQTTSHLRQMAELL